eukprot:CAMPEP_0172816080 /NCGR_PEP_ID=MMETSP1075-20121228/12203_1 /TAXON_ID=2916 /ORGANISM="Ceratium fusus, Strain PA161109" /LENGTH=147 /DNA_ID=CAMNT_0013656007 /DNA_START=113 /DNA_END=556 /DNA_ORIENTATION=+
MARSITVTLGGAATRGAASQSTSQSALSIFELSHRLRTVSPRHPRRFAQRTTHHIASHCVSGSLRFKADCTEASAAATASSPCSQRQASPPNTSHCNKHLHAAREPPRQLAAKQGKVPSDNTNSATSLDSMAALNPRDRIPVVRPRP